MGTKGRNASWRSCGGHSGDVTVTVACPLQVQTNVDGVYDRPPEEAGARLLRHIIVRKGTGRGAMTTMTTLDGTLMRKKSVVAPHTCFRG